MRGSTRTGPAATPPRHTPAPHPAPRAAAWSRFVSRLVARPASQDDPDAVKRTLALSAKAAGKQPAVEKDKENEVGPFEPVQLTRNEAAILAAATNAANAGEAEGGQVSTNLIEMYVSLPPRPLPRPCALTLLTTPDRHHPLAPQVD